jgi:alpha-L-arabinofuranosidase
LVNAIAPIMTETGGPAWRQTIFHPFAQMSNLGRGNVLRSKVNSPTYAARYYDPRGNEELYYPMPEVPYVKVASVHNEDDKTLTLFVLNRHLEEPITLDLDARGFSDLSLDYALELRHDDLQATNTKTAPDAVSPVTLDGVQVRGGRVQATLAPASWNVIRLKTPA